MIDCLNFIPDRDWLVSIARDNVIIIWKVIGSHFIGRTTEGVPYLAHYQTDHRDFVRSMIHKIPEIQNNSDSDLDTPLILVTSSEDKSVRFFSVS
jgi:WD40 repeat protein